ncbi:F/Y-rich N-terminus-domain-containing protein [Halteromyces radiatus]|uniref:F/Y-rich N-terminus-domain-containing protein n=1 Tax=Halteromyces radiatus TaxID=101107 RepID=UPI002220199D|nr:F/Y-rich N-terminus-domain-containing protein [Halteromyces radiatus]KAI8089357.1 F/Y-rich N-terminus-domain-containing protein [Halteromyces radiatus]
MFLQPDSDCAVYSAHFQATNIFNKDVLTIEEFIWEGHGLVSWILEGHQHTNHHVNGKLYQHHIEVKLQLHKVRQGFHLITSTKQTRSPSSPRSSMTTPVPCLNSYDNNNNHRHKVLETHQPHESRLPPLLFHATTPTSSPKRKRSLSSSSLSTSSSSTDRQPFSSHSTFDITSAKNTNNNNNEINKLSTSPPLPASSSSSFTQSNFSSNARRKKRDTKPPNVDDIRTFIQIEQDEQGNYCLPVEIDSWTVYSLGHVVYDRPAFHNQRYIYPVGYKVKKWYRSMVDPKSDTQYVCEILDGGQEPVFRLQADDDPLNVYTGPTPTTVWTIAVRQAFAIRNMDYGHNPVGPDFFGLRKNTIAKMIQDLPNADKCSNYIWQQFSVANLGKPAKRRMYFPPQAR